MTLIEEVRHEREELAHVLKKHRGIRKLVENLYPDTAHFIYELLQNAEDAEATEAHFTLSKKNLIFEHNGRPFDKSDLLAITDIGEGTKADADDKIGRFGIGFKAVFTYTETPLIWSPSFSFKISDFVLPNEINPQPDIANKTRFEFPFNNPKKHPEDAFVEIETCLNGLDETTLLFLTNLKSISWGFGKRKPIFVQKFQPSINHILIIKKGKKKITNNSHYLIFTQPAGGLKKQKIAIAFGLRVLPKIHNFDSHKPLANQMKIIPLRGRVFIYFPAEKETSGLRFHLNGPFVPELSRASVRETPVNQPLFEQLAKLTANSLHEIRKLGFLTTGFLEVLPNFQDEIPERYEKIRSAVINEMRAKALTPTHTRTHAPATSLLQGPAVLKGLLTKKDLQFFRDSADKPFQWVAEALKNSKANRFLDDLELKKLDLDNFARNLANKASDNRWNPIEESFVQWLSSKPPEWFQKLYATLYKELGSDGDFSQFKDARIVRDSEGSLKKGVQCYFPSDGFVYDDVFPRVDNYILTIGKRKKQKTNAKKFLDAIGVREVGEPEKIKAILNARYSKSFQKPDLKIYKKDLRRFFSLVKKEPDNVALFDRYYIFRGKGKRWCRPREIFLAKPFLQTQLEIYFKALGEKATKVPLHLWYRKSGVSMKKLVKFAEAVGAQTRLEIKGVTCYDNPKWEYLRSVPGERITYSSKNKDYNIPNLKDFLTKPTLEKSKLVWSTLVNLENPSQFLEAIYQKNSTSGYHKTDSQLIFHLRGARWIPQVKVKNIFSKPEEASRNLLPGGFTFDRDWLWIKAIGFGQKLDEKSEENRQKQESDRQLARQLGIPVGNLDYVKQFASFPEETKKRILADYSPSTGNNKQRDTRAAGEQAEHGGKKASRGVRRRNGEKQQLGSGKRRAESKTFSFVSYVATHPSSEEPDPEGLTHKQRIDLEEKAIEAILKKEPHLSRTPKNNPGFDLVENNKDGKPITWIEVKSMRGSFDGRPVGMSKTQFDFGREHGDAYWLYIVENAASESPAILKIQNPAGKTETFTFDHGWRDIAITDEN